MQRLVLGDLSLLALAGCNTGNGFDATIPRPVGPPPTVGVSANPPDNPTGSDRYQSPDLERSRPLPGGRR